MTYMKKIHYTNDALYFTQQNLLTFEQFKDQGDIILYDDECYEDDIEIFEKITHLEYIKTVVYFRCFKDKSRWEDYEYPHELFFEAFDFYKDILYNGPDFNKTAHIHNGHGYDFDLVEELLNLDELKNLLSNEC